MYVPLRGQANARKVTDNSDFYQTRSFVAVGVGRVFMVDFLKMDHFTTIKHNKRQFRSTNNTQYLAVFIVDICCGLLPE
jgi:hypothetical protein